MVWGRSGQNLIKLQLKSNSKLKQNGLEWARPEIEAKWSEVGQGRVFLENVWKGFFGHPSNTERRERSEPSEAPTGRPLHAQTNH